MTASQQRTAAVLGVTLFFSYAYFYGAGGWNQNSRFAMIRAVLERGTLQIDAYQLHTGDRAFWRGHYYTDKAPGASLLALAPVQAARLVSRAAGVDPASFPGIAWTSYVAAVVTSGVFTAIAALCVFWLSLRWGATTGAALFAASAYGLSTPAWAYATLFMGHGQTAGCLMIALVAADLLADRPVRVRLKLGGIIGLAGGWAVVTEFQAAVPAVFIGLLAIARLGVHARLKGSRSASSKDPRSASSKDPRSDSSKDPRSASSGDPRSESSRGSGFESSKGSGSERSRVSGSERSRGSRSEIDGAASLAPQRSASLSGERDLVPVLTRIAAGVAVAAVPLFVYNTLAFGSPFHLGYSSEEGFKELQTGFFGITYPSLWRVRELLFGAYRGLLPLSPLMAAVPVGLTLLGRKGRGGPALVAGGIGLYYLLLNASYFYWEGGWAFGPRQMTAALPFLALGLAPLWDLGRLAGRGLLLAGWIWGVGVTLVGVSTTPQPPASFKAPMRELLWPAFRDGDLSLNPQTFVHNSVDVEHLRGGGDPHAAWNLGELAGLRGLSSLLPLAFLWVVAGVLLLLW